MSFSNAYFISRKKRKLYDIVMTKLQSLNKCELFITYLGLLSSLCAPAIPPPPPPFPQIRSLNLPGHPRQNDVNLFFMFGYFFFIIDNHNVAMRVDPGAHCSGGSRGWARGPSPPLFLDQNEAQSAKKNVFFFKPGPPLSQSLDDQTPPPPLLSEGLDPPLHCLNKL